jgi:DNA polymerase delta subunit 1
MNKKVWGKFRKGLINMDIVERMTPEGFTNGKKYLFARLIFNNSHAMRKFRFLFEYSKVYIPGVIKSTKFKTYEANLPPMLRCFHTIKVSGCSWVKVDKYEEIEEEDERESFCDIELRVDWRKIKPIEKDQNAPLRILSFDIECNSIDGRISSGQTSGRCGNSNRFNLYILGRKSSISATHCLFR